MQHLEGSGTPVLYIGRTVLKGNVHEDKVLDRKHALKVTSNKKD
jgi:hypothetical protein